MAHTILSLLTERFDTRAVYFGDCLLNINGETLECVVSREACRSISPLYRVCDSHGQQLCAFRPQQLWGGPYFYEIEGVSQGGGSATLIVPASGFLGEDGETVGQCCEYEADAAD